MSIEARRTAFWNAVYISAEHQLQIFAVLITHNVELIYSNFRAGRARCWFTEHRVMRFNWLCYTCLGIIHACIAVWICIIYGANEYAIATDLIAIRVHNIYNNRTLYHIDNVYDRNTIDNINFAKILQYTILGRRSNHNRTASAFPIRLHAA